MRFFSLRVLISLSVTIAPSYAAHRSIRLINERRKAAQEYQENEQIQMRQKPKTPFPTSAPEPEDAHEETRDPFRDESEVAYLSNLTNDAATEEQKRASTWELTLADVRQKNADLKNPEKAKQEVRTRADSRETYKNSRTVYPKRRNACCGARPKKQTKVKSADDLAIRRRRRAQLALGANFHAEYARGCSSKAVVPEYMDVQPVETFPMSRNGDDECSRMSGTTGGMELNA